MQLEDLIEALWTWDPIGIAEFRHEAPSEYESLAARLLVAAESGGAPDVEASARQFLTDLGLRPVHFEEFMEWVRRELSEPGSAGGGS